MRHFGKFTAAALFALAAPFATPASADDIIIGGLFPFSGPNAVYGDVLSSGAKLAVKHINADKMLSGELSIAYEDTQALPQPAVVAMQKLVSVMNVPFTLSSFTGVSKAIAPIGTRNEVVMVNGGGVGPDLAELGDYFWNVIPLANLEVRASVPYAVKEMGKSKFALIYVDDPLGASILKEMESVLEEVGGELVSEMSVAPTAQQFSGLAAKVRSSGADAVYIASYGAQQVQIAKQLRDNGVDAQMMSYSAYGVPDAMALPENEGAIFTAQAVTLDSTDPVTKRFVDDYKAQFGKDPAPYNVNYYNATMLFAILAQALESEGKEVTGANLLAKRKEVGSFDLVGGNVSFLDNGTLLFPIDVKVIEGGAARTLATVDIQ
jgi:ABC-type branched-subunit amino acid transport system substrate-binding protein